MKSLLTNTFFGMKEGPDTGDCGFICLMIGISSDVEVLQWLNKKVLKFYNVVLFGKNLVKKNLY